MIFNSIPESNLALIEFLWSEADYLLIKNLFNF